MNRYVQSSSIEAMSTTINVVSVGIPEHEHHAAMDVIAAEIQTWDHRFSRFRADSMLSSVNAASGQWAPVDEIFIDLLETARSYVSSTHGRFNPAILPALEAQGYDRTIDVVRGRIAPPTTTPGDVAGINGWQRVEIDRRGRRVRLPMQMRIDFGGIAKGALSDRLADRFGHWPGGAISIGGDLNVWGAAPDGDNWRVGIEHPRDSARDITEVLMPAGDRSAIATSSRTKRMWRTNTGHSHHLIDPFTGMPATGPLLAATVCASTATVAEVTTKNVFLSPTFDALSLDALPGVRWALLIDDALRIQHISLEAA